MHSPDVTNAKQPCDVLCAHQHYTHCNLTKSRIENFPTTTSSHTYFPLRSKHRNSLIHYYSPTHTGSSLLKSPKLPTSLSPLRPPCTHWQLSSSFFCAYRSRYLASFQQTSAVLPRNYLNLAKNHLLPRFRWFNRKRQWYQPGQASTSTAPTVSIRQRKFWLERVA